MVDEVWKWQNDGISRFRAVAELSDGYVVVAGEEERDSGTDYDFVAFKLDPWDGRVIWKWKEGSTEDDRIEGAVAGADGCVVLTGFTAGSWSEEHIGDLDYAAAKLDSNGTVIWRLQGGSTNRDDLESGALEQDGSVILVGQLSDDYLLVKVASNGTVLWSWAGTTTEDEWGKAVVKSEDDDSCVVALRFSESWHGPNDRADDFAAVKVDSSRQQVWRWEGGTERNDTTTSMVGADDGSVIISGATNGSFVRESTGLFDFAAVKLADNGTELWRWQDGTPATDYILTSAMASDGFLVMAGYTEGDWIGTSNERRDFMAVKLDASDGSTEAWRWQDGTSSSDLIYGVVTVSNDSMVLVGYTHGAFGRTRDDHDPEGVIVMLRTISPSPAPTSAPTQQTSPAPTARATSPPTPAPFVSASSPQQPTTIPSTPFPSSTSPSKHSTVAPSVASGDASAFLLPGNGWSALMLAFAMISAILFIAGKIWGVNIGCFKKRDAHGSDEPGTPSITTGTVPRRDPENRNDGDQHQLGGAHLPKPKRSAGVRHEDNDASLEQDRLSLLPGHRRLVASAGWPSTARFMSRTAQIDHAVIQDGPPLSSALGTTSVNRTGATGRREDTRGFHDAHLGERVRNQESTMGSTVSTARVSIRASLHRSTDDTLRFVTSSDPAYAVGIRGGSYERRNVNSRTGVDDDAPFPRGSEPQYGGGLRLRDSQATLRAAQELARRTKVPAIVEAVTFVEVLAEQIVDHGRNKSAAESGHQWCWSTLEILKQAANLLDEGHGSPGGTASVFLDGVRESIGNLVQLMRVYKSKRKLVRVVKSSFFKRRREELDATINTAVSGPQLRQWRERRKRRLDQLIIPEGQLTLTDELLDNGAFGTVYIADYTGINVAAKVLQIKGNVGDSDDDDDDDGMFEDRPGNEVVERRMGLRKAFLRELAEMKRLSSPYTVHVYGAVTSRNGRSVLVMELMSGGDLRTFLKNAVGSIPEYRARRIMGDVCAGMGFLHKNQTVHGCLKSSNVLFDGIGKAKIGDFGKSRWTQYTTSTGLATYETKQHLGSQMSLPWAAPEVLDKGERSFKSDVYSFGMVVWEILTRNVPWEAKLNEFELFLSVVLKGERPDIPEDVPADLVYIMRACWVTVPSERPSFESILKLMEFYDCKKA